MKRETKGIREMIEDSPRAPRRKLKMEDREELLSMSSKLAYLFTSEL